MKGKQKVCADEKTGKDVFSLTFINKLGGGLLNPVNRKQIYHRVSVKKGKKIVSLHRFYSRARMRVLIIKRKHRQK